VALRLRGARRQLAAGGVLLAPVFAAIETQDRASFDRAFAAATDNANRQHVETGYGYIRWTLPNEAPKDLDLGPG
jgi:hypothetical protein